MTRPGEPSRRQAWYLGRFDELSAISKHKLIILFEQAVQLSMLLVPIGTADSTVN